MCDLGEGSPRPLKSNFIMVQIVEHGKRTMTKEDILSIFQNFAWSQGFYGRLLRDINLYPEWGQEFLDDIISKNFTNELDVILYVEGGM